MAESLSLTAIYEPVEEGWVQARLQEIPGVITAAPTADKAREMLLDALREFLLSFTQEPLSSSGAGSSHERLEITLSA